MTKPPRYWTTCPACRRGYAPQAHQDCPHCGAPRRSDTLTELARLQQAHALLMEWRYRTLACPACRQAVHRADCILLRILALLEAPS